MSVLEQMRPFFRFCQFAGFFPFRMETDGRFGKFRQFSFSWRHPITWWYVELAMIQLISYYFIYTSALKSYEVDKLPLIIYVSLTTSGAIYFFVLLSARYWITFRLSPLRRVVEILHGIERRLQEHPHCKSNTKKRITIGLFCAFGWISCAMFMPFKFLADSGFIGKEGMWVALFVLVTGSLLMMASCCLFLSIHLVYYQMSYYIRLLRYQLAEGLTLSPNIGWATKISSGSNETITRGEKEEERMKNCQILFGELVKAAKEWNSIFSIPVLLIVTTKMMTASCSLFAFIQGLLIPNYYLNTMRWFMLATSLMDCIMLAIIFTAADMPVNQALKLREEIIEINNNWLSTHSIVSPLCLQTSSFLEQVKEDRLRLSTGLFNVGVHLIPALTGSIVTYLVILLQTT